MDHELNPYGPPPLNANSQTGEIVARRRLACPNCNHPEAFFWHYTVPGSTRCSHCGTRIRLRLPGVLRRFDWTACGFLALVAILCGYFAPVVVLETTLLLWLLILAADVILNQRLGYLEVAFPWRER